MRPAWRGVSRRASGPGSGAECPSSRETGRGRKGGRPLARHATHVRGEPGAKPFVDDLLLGRGFVRSRAAPSLRSIESQPSTQGFVLRARARAARRGRAGLLFPPSGRSPERARSSHLDHRRPLLLPARGGGAPSNPAGVAHRPWAGRAAARTRWELGGVGRSKRGRGRRAPAPAPRPAFFLPSAPPGLPVPGWDGAGGRRSRGARRGPPSSPLPGGGGGRTRRASGRGRRPRSSPSAARVDQLPGPRKPGGARGSLNRLRVVESRPRTGAASRRQARWSDEDAALSSPSPSGGRPDVSLSLRLLSLTP